MYHMKNLISTNEEIILPKCMYPLKNLANIYQNDIEINISDQVTKFLKKMPANQLLDLENRQDKLLIKLDILYERIKKISSLCILNPHIKQELTTNVTEHQEIVIILNTENLPWFLNIFLKHKTLSVSWHIHSSISNAKVAKVKAFFKKFQDLYQLKPESKINLRLIFKSESANPELKVSSLDVPILGNVNIIRYLCLVYNDVVPYDYQDYQLDSFLDICHQLETAPEKKKENYINNIFANNSSSCWVYTDNFSIADLAVFNAIKQMQSGTKSVPKKWLNECEKNIL